MSSRMLKQLAEEYINFSVKGKEVSIPYVLVNSRWRFSRSSGKGTPEEIRAELYRLAERQGVDLEKLTPLEITKFMRENKIGIECSGFVYQILARWLKESKNIEVAMCLSRLPGIIGHWERRLMGFKRVRRISANTLTNNLNTIRIGTVGEILIGDLIRLTPQKWHGKHVAIIVAIDDEKITYAHSGRDTARQGPHFGTIIVDDQNKDLDEQEWQEVTKDGRNYGSVAYHKENGDSVRRLKCLV